RKGIRKLSILVCLVVALFLRLFFTSFVLWVNERKGFKSVIGLRKL
ncbi:hypothetical protein KSS87_002117, partial [Heliosperma pusillum]